MKLNAKCAELRKVILSEGTYAKLRGENLAITTEEDNYEC
jgi:hypothetical protein